MMGIKQVFYAVKNLPNTIYNIVVLKYRHVKYGHSLKINGRILCISNTRDGIVIGDNVRLNASRGSNPIGG